VVAQQLRQVGRDRPSQLRVADDDLGDRRADQVRRKAAAGGFYFG
jgi:hypothetical protein